MEEVGLVCVGAELRGIKFAYMERRADAVEINPSEQRERMPIDVDEVGDPLRHCGANAMAMDHP